ncbi:putative iron-only hydrogenase system regulator [Aedoeadaptatus nemausensis]|uniref:Putative iron-only hydrogenase system regulator n=1 Tax=Aedoeadaptatus nemausensis TaxID=2582829 RepID=A0A6V6XZC4_9FIRM|nr:TM1266 family iron-only hydrogenase system putative regulator [Peptoniphilus nemausensis]CAC9923601.1 putative iron-only hydrogenase system regulator [Peptoniphilus nemausensis]
MNEKLGIIAIIVESNEESVVESINKLLHESRHIIVGRLGIPYPKRGLSLISIAVDGEQDQINALSGKLGMLDHVTVKTTLAGVL